VEICPACRQETFDGRRECHRCGASVAAVIPLELSSRDVATLVSRLPLRSRHGDLHLTIDGARFVDKHGRELLPIPTASVVSVDAQGATDLDIQFTQANTTQRARFRVRWAQVTDTAKSLPESRLRPLLHTPRNDQARKASRARSLVCDRWQAARTPLLSADRYMLRRAR
jgi:hypothetical protein